MNGQGTRVLVCLALAALPRLAAGQARLELHGGGVVVIQGQAIVGDQGAVRVVPGVAVPLSAADPLIGDPWWDEAAGVPAPAPAGPVPGDRGEQLRRLAQERAEAQRRAQAMGQLRRELSVVRDACPSLDADARAKVVTAGRAAVASGQPPEPAIVSAVAGVAPPAEAAAYAREREQRARRRRAATVAVIVEAVDREAWLDVDQRRAVTAALEAAWRPSWDGISVAALRQPLAVGQLPGEIRDCIVGVVGPDLSAGRQPQQEPSR